MHEQSGAKLGRWAWLSLFVAAGTVLFADTNRFMPPVGEKYVDHVEAGAWDLLPSYDAAYAFLLGENPYHFHSAQLPDPRLAEHVTYLYPPSHFLIYVPLVWYAGTDFITAARVQFIVGCLAVVALALALLALLTETLPLAFDLRCALLPLIAMVLVLNPGCLLGLERGQSDLITSALCWWAAVLFLRERFGFAAFLATASCLLKGYGLPFAVGLLLLALRPAVWRSTLLGALIAIALLLAPVARYLPDALLAYPIRAKMFWPHWYNQSVFNLVFVLRPALAGIGRAVIIVIAAAVTGMTWWQLRCALRTSQAQRRTMALVMFTTTALILILTVSLNSLAYTAALVLPGSLYLAITQSQLMPGASSPYVNMIGAWLALCTFGLCAFSFSRLSGRLGVRDLPIHGAGLLGLLLLIGFLTLQDLRQATKI